MSSLDNKRIAKNTLYLYIRLLFVLIISLYSSRVVLETLGIVDYGIYNVVAGFVLMFGLLSTSLSGATQRYYNYEKGKNKVGGVSEVFMTSLYIQFLISVCIIIISETIGLWYIDNKMVYPLEQTFSVHVVFHTSVAALIMVVLQIPYTAAIIAYEHINYYAIIGVLDVVSKLIIAIIVPFLGKDRLAIYGALLASVSVLDFICYFIYATRHFTDLKYSFHFNKILFLDMIGYAGWRSFDGISQTVKNQGVNILMNLYFGPVVNAARGISYQIKSALLGFVTNITIAANPQMVEAYASGNRDRAMRIMFTISKMVFLSLYIAALPIMIEINYVLKLWLGSNIPDYTGIFAVLVLMITLVDILLSPITMIINAKGNIGKYTFWTSSIGLLILPVAFLLFELGFRPEMAFVASFFISVVMLYVGVYYLKKEVHMSIKQYVTEVLKPLFYVIICTVVGPLFVSLYLNEGFIRLIIVSIISISLVLIFGYNLGLDTRERLTIIGYVNQFFKKLKAR